MDAVACSELGQDPGYVGAHGGLAHDQRVGDLGVGQSPGDQSQDLDLSWGQLAQGGRDSAARWGAVDELFDESAGDVGGEQGVTAAMSRTAAASCWAGPF